MKIKILIIAYRLDWKSWDKKLEEIKEFFADTPFELDIHVAKQQFDDIEIPFSVYNYSHTGTNAVKAKRGVDKEWYDKNVLPRARKYDIVCLAVDRDYWIKHSGSKTLRGWHTGDEPSGVHETQVAAWEHNKVVYRKSKTTGNWGFFGVSKHYHSPDRVMMNQFVYTFIHEVDHALSSILGVKDKLHDFVDNHNFRRYSLSYLAKETYRKEIRTLLGKIIATLTNKIDNIMRTQEPIVHTPIEDFTQNDISQYFGENQNYYSQQFGLIGHNGVDITGEFGEQIFAVRPGTVVSVQWDSTGFGHHIKIITGDGEEWTYAHNSNQFVQVGEVVADGDIIATLGNSGTSSGPHLHIGVRNVILGQGWRYPGSDILLSVEDYDNGYRGAVDPMKHLKRLV